MTKEAKKIQDIINILNPESIINKMISGFSSGYIIYDNFIAKIKPDNKNYLLTIKMKIVEDDSEAVLKGEKSQPCLKDFDLDVLLDYKNIIETEKLDNPSLVFVYNLYIWLDNKYRYREHIIHADCGIYSDNSQTINLTHSLSNHIDLDNCQKNIMELFKTNRLELIF